jgi:zinc transporter, ZIP family
MVSARVGAISLATVLIIGFALHNATEGFGIVGPLGDAKPRGDGWHSPG